ncbi:MAG: thioredoxin [Bacteroidetes bacterium]|nr:thioredoxin [Bacteroidota bacterium]
MPVTKSTDSHLRKLGISDKYTIVKYDHEQCFYCKQLAQPYEDLSNREEFSDILFLQMSASENPVARHEVETKKMPFLSIYQQGILIDCGCVRSEKGMLRFLEKLRRAGKQKQESGLSHLPV